MQGVINAYPLALSILNRCFVLHIHFTGYNWVLLQPYIMHYPLYESTDITREKQTWQKRLQKHDIKIMFKTNSNKVLTSNFKWNSFICHGIWIKIKLDMISDPENLDQQQR